MLEYYDRANSRDPFRNKVWDDNGNGNFASVHFRINTIGFNSYGSFDNENDRVAFYNEAAEIIKSFGIVNDCGYKQNNEYLHSHPNDISGIVEKSKIKAIAEALNNSKTMKIRWIDVYEEYVYMSDDDYMEILKSKRDDIAKYIIERCFTKRTNLFKSSFEIAIAVQETFKINRINAIEDINNPKTTFKYAVQIIKQLIDNGYLVYVEENNNHYIRSFNKTEQRKNKINYDVIKIGA